MNIGCVVMAAGRSVRFGSNKLLHPLAGRPVLAHVLDSLPRRRLSRITAVASAPEVARLCHRAGIPCLLYEGGPQSETIRLGIGAMAGTDGCMFVMGDQPLCSTGSMERLADAFTAHPDAVIRLAFRGRPCSPVIFPSRYYPQLAALSGERGGMAAVAGLSPRLCLVEAEEEAELWDSDTPEELKRLEAHLLEKMNRHTKDGLPL